MFKEALQTLADRLGPDIRVAHYPRYCSKHNPIEHRLFPHITQACKGVVFHTVAIAVERIGADPLLPFVFVAKTPIPVVFYPLLLADMRVRIVLFFVKELINRFRCESTANYKLI